MENRNNKKQIIKTIIKEKTFPLVIMTLIFSFFVIKKLILWADKIFTPLFLLLNMKNPPGIILGPIVIFCFLLGTVISTAISVIILYFIEAKDLRGHLAEVDAQGKKGIATWTEFYLNYMCQKRKTTMGAWLSYEIGLLTFYKLFDIDSIIIPIDETTYMMALNMIMSVFLPFDIFILLLGFLAIALGRYAEGTRDPWYKRIDIFIWLACICMLLSINIVYVVWVILTVISGIGIREKKGEIGLAKRGIIVTIICVIVSFLPFSIGLPMLTRAVGEAVRRMLPW